MNKPKIRFKGFNDDWEQRKLGELGTLKNGMNFSKEAMGVGFPFVNLQNIFGNNVINANDLGLAMASEAQLKDYNLLEGDVLFVRSSVKLEGVGEAALVPISLENTTYSGFIIRFRDKYGLDKNFKRFIFCIDSIRSRIMSQATNSANKNISQFVLKNLDLKIPCKNEQVKIGEYFSNLDCLITLHQRKCDEVKKLKKYMLQNMFPQDGEKVPKIRFEGFTNDWEQRKLEDYLYVSSQKNKEEKYGKEDVLSVSGDYGIVNQIEFQGRSFAGVSVANYGVVEKGDIVYTKSPLKANPYGIIKTNKGKTGIVSTLYVVYKPNKNTNSEFVQVYFEQDARMNSYMHPLVNKGAKNDMKVSAKNALQGNVIFPKIQEQKQISIYFKTLDHLITLHQRKCEELKNMKKFMLQNMFV
ncbi:restriction endonuclease subunit S [Faecalitalea cylindroides]|uniref:restriction endonuclease subunit S n=1 Tax=Faecalitalea cylindroides TaxID=39483 RepID=UPI001897B17C|nr:restriction endonuclease subunit S [Faecalitalea cylindroides]